MRSAGNEQNGAVTSRCFGHAGFECAIPAILRGISAAPPMPLLTKNASVATIGLYMRITLEIRLTFDSAVRPTADDAVGNLTLIIQIRDVFVVVHRKHNRIGAFVGRPQPFPWTVGAWELTRRWSRPIGLRNHVVQARTGTSTRRKPASISHCPRGDDGFVDR